MRIEQAIFTSTNGPTNCGYRLVATSPEVTTDESQELARWGPSHDSLLESDAAASSIHFHGLASGRLCIGKSSHAGSEYSGRGGLRVYTQSLVIAREDFVRFANNPFAVIRAATAQGRMQVLETVPPQLEPLRLSGKTPAVDHALLADVLSRFGLDVVIGLVDAVLTSQQVILVGDRARQPLIAALLNCLPVECRAELSFATGLKPSPRRHFRILCLGEENNETRRWARTTRALVFRPDDARRAEPKSAWAQYLQQVLSTGRTHMLGSHLAQERPALSLAGLDTLASELALEEERSIVDDSTESATEPDEVFPRLASVCMDELNSVRSRHDTNSSGGRFAPGPLTTPAIIEKRQPIASPPKGETALCGSAVPALEALERLDDLVFAALAGDSVALDQLPGFWDRTLAQWGTRELAESREHYVRRALAAWRRAQSSVDAADAELATKAIEVVCSLYGE
jgi:hypothetical protein